MKKISTLIASLVFVATGAQAQWTPDDKAFTVIGTDSIYGQSVIKSVRTTDGKIVLTWLKTPVGMRYDNPAYGYYLYMQSFGTDGKPLLGKAGKVIVGKPTRSSVTDYSLQATADGNVVISYTDTRNDPMEKAETVHKYYCYTPEGESVWSDEGVDAHIEVPTCEGHTYGALVPMAYVSGNNIYGTILTTDTYNVKADETNWQPNPWYPDEEMPDSVSVTNSAYQIMRYNSDGTAAWTSSISLSTDNLWAYPAPDGGIYLLYTNSGNGLDARRINSDGNDVWDSPVNVESGQIGTDMYTDEPTVEPDGNGGLMLVYRKLLNYSGYMVANHLSPDGSVYGDEFIVNGSQDGDSSSPVVAVNGDKVFTAFEYDYAGKNLWVNQLDINGDYTWEGDNLLGYAYSTNDMWGFRPVKAIAQADGWVMLYGDIQSYSGANFYIVKFDFDGQEVWRRQLAEDNFASSGFSVVNDDKNAYIFYTCDKEYDSNWQPIPGEGGLRMMCVDISGKTTGVNRIESDSTCGSRVVYNAEGMRLAGDNVPGLYIVKENGKTRKVVRK